MMTGVKSKRQRRLAQRELAALSRLAGRQRSGRKRWPQSQIGQRQLMEKAPTNFSTVPGRAQGGAMKVGQALVADGSRDPAKISAALAANR